MNMSHDVLLFINNMKNLFSDKERIFILNYFCNSCGKTGSDCECNEEE